MFHHWDRGTRRHTSSYDSTTRGRPFQRGKSDKPKTPNSPVFSYNFLSQRKNILVHTLAGKMFYLSKCRIELRCRFCYKLIFTSISALLQMEIHSCQFLHVTTGHIQSKHLSIVTTNAKMTMHSKVQMDSIFFRIL